MARRVCRTWIVRAQSSRGTPMLNAIPVVATDRFGELFAAGDLEGDPGRGTGFESSGS
jgi:hypothetical protein